ncbi:MAG: hypothetical protein VYC32_14500 [Planctomycetota bacterium]|nr:hypothetical protein [Planctomycetota bacterium]
MTGKLALTLLLSTAAFFFAGALAAEDKKDRDTLVRDDLSEMRDSDLWIYNDVEKGFELARKTSKPLLIVFR